MSDETKGTVKFGSLGPEGAQVDGEIQGLRLEDTTPLTEAEQDIFEDVISGKFFNLALSRVHFDGKDAAVIVAVTIDEEAARAAEADENGEIDVEIRTTPLALLLPTLEGIFDRLTPIVDDSEQLLKQVNERHERKHREQVEDLIDLLHTAQARRDGGDEAPYDQDAEPDRPSSEVAEELLGTRPAAPSDD